MSERKWTLEEIQTEASRFTDGQTVDYILKALNALPLPETKQFDEAAEKVWRERYGIYPCPVCDYDGSDVDHDCGASR
jgi:hypothetical protein